MNTVAKAVLFGLATVGATVAASAHHSFPATYHVDRTQTINGKVVAFLFRNPHSFVQIMAPDNAGKMQRWAIEWSAGAVLAADKVTARTLKVGDQVTITGNPGRNASDHRMRMNKIVRPADGWRWEGRVE